MMDLIEMARDTLESVRMGYYVSPSGSRVDIASDVAACVAATTLHTPEALSELAREVLERPSGDGDAMIEFRNETTLEGAQALLSSGAFTRVGALNFASALSAGGRFLAGAQAQEENLARRSALYESLVACPAYYRFHHEQDDPLYSDHMIYSPSCPVFRSERGDYLEAPYLVDFLTSPAPYAGFANLGDPAVRADFRRVFMERGKKVLALFAAKECEALVLGAWGCGAFLNDPVMVAAMFQEYVGPGGLFNRRFRHIRFSVPANIRDPRNYDTFRRAFGHIGEDETGRCR